MSATTAIAVLALSNSPVFAQDTGAAAPAPVASEPAPSPVTAAPEPTPEAAPVTTDSIDTSTPVKSTETTATPVKKTSPKVAKKTVAATAPAKKASTVAPTAAAPVLASAAPATAPLKPAPVVDTTAAPTEPAAPTTTAEAKPVGKVDDTTMMVGGGALALLALGGGAFALARRKDEDEEYRDEEIVHDGPDAAEPPAPMPRHDPVVMEDSAIVAPAASAFAWGNTPAVEERRAGETWYDRAMRGPTPENPSLSLRKRLKRAAFFDKREREVAAGTAQRVDTDAGLPESMDTRELELA